MKIIIFIIIIVIVIIRQIKLEKGAKKGLEKIIDLRNSIADAENSTLTSSQKEIYLDWCTEVKKAYDRIENSYIGWNQGEYDKIYKETYPNIDTETKNKYNISKSELERTIEIGDVISAKQISSKEMDISNRVIEVKKGEFCSKIQVAKEFNTTLYEIDEAMKKSTINAMLDLINNK